MNATIGRSTITRSLSVVIEQEKFQQAISLVSKAIAKNSVQPVLGNILIKANDNNTLTVSATDLDLSMSVDIPANILEEGEVTVPSQKLSELVSKLPHQSITFKSSESALISLACGRSKFEIKGLSSEQFPQQFLKIKEGINR